MKKNYKYTFAIIISIISVYCYSQEERALEFEASYVSEGVSNLDGGMETGSAYLGMIDLAATFNTETAGLWNKGLFFVQLESTHGGTPSGDYIGDQQVASNIENGNYTYLYQLWFNQEFGNFSLLAGIHDINADFFASDYAGEYINSSFGIMPSASLNVPVAIFPRTSLGGFIKYQVNDNSSFQLGLYDGDPFLDENDPYINDFNVSQEEGALIVGEYWLPTLNKIGYDGTLKIGGYYHTNEFASVIDTSGVTKGNYGLYAILDQVIIPEDENGRSMGMFATFGYAPSDINICNFSWGIGTNLYAPFKSRADDIAGIGMHNAKFNTLQDDLTLISEVETAIELFYKLTINDNIQIQPEIQYIMNPGAESNYNNATVGIIRAYFNL